LCKFIISGAGLGIAMPDCNVELYRFTWSWVGS